MRNILFFILSIISFFSCKEVYDPELEFQPKVLVVDGLITDEIKEHKIRLSRAVRFDTFATIPEQGALVYIKDNNGNIYNFTENLYGNYFSDSTVFRPKTGDKYTLFINTKDGKAYASEEQELLPRLTLDNVSSKAREVPYYLTIDNKLKVYNINGAEFVATQTINLPQEKYSRFSSTLLVEFTSLTEGVISYCWEKYDASVYPLLSEIQNSNPGVFQHKLGFFPLNVYFYGIYEFTRVDGRPPREIKTYNYLYHYFVSIKQYHQNKNIYDIYKLVNQQLKADEKIFDPVNLQITGNIKCTSHPTEEVFGLFDVSSVSISTFMIDSSPMEGVFELFSKKPIDFDTIPKDGFIPYVPPSTWVY
jgi:hypothetical protein